MSLVEVNVPDIGGASDVDIIEICVKPGDEVAVDQSLIVLESDKGHHGNSFTTGWWSNREKVKVGDKGFGRTPHPDAEDRRGCSPRPEKRRSFANPD